MRIDLSRALANFSANPFRTARELRDLADQQPEEFLQAALPLLRSSNKDRVFDFILSILYSRDRLLESVCDPDLFQIEEASELMKRLAQIDPGVNLKLCQTIFGHLEQGKGTLKSTPTPRILRCLDLLIELGYAPTAGVTAYLLAHPDSHVRSKATLAVGKARRKHEWVAAQLGDPDARVRSNAVESLWGLSSPQARQAFRSAMTDSDNRVVGNAILGLYLAGDPEADEFLRGMLQDEREKFKRTAVWAIGETGDPRFLPLLQRMIESAPGRLLCPLLRARSKLQRSKKTDADRLPARAGISR